MSGKAGYGAHIRCKLVLVQPSIRRTCVLVIDGIVVAVGSEQISSCIWLETVQGIVQICDGCQCVPPRT